MTSRLLTFAVWALIAASGLFWGLKLFVRATALPASAQVAGRMGAMGGELTRVLGAAAEPTDEDEPAADAGDGRFHLLGVVAPRGDAAAAQGLALIAVGEQPARAWRIGSVIEGDTVLLSVGKRSAQLGPRGGPATTELSLPEPAAAATGAVPGQVARPPVFSPPPGVRPNLNMAAPGQPVKPAAAQSSDDEDE
jgi:general secretion pathway protein C